MNAHAAAMRYSRAPLVYQRASLRPAPLRRRQGMPLNALRGVIAWTPQERRSLWAFPLAALRPSHLRLLMAGVRMRRAITAMIQLVPLDFTMAFRLAAGAVVAAMAALAVINNQRSAVDDLAASIARNETVVYRQMPTGKKLIVEDEGEPAVMESDEPASASYPRAVQTVKFVNAEQPNSSGFAALRARVMEKVGAFIAFPGKQAAEQTATADAGWPSGRGRKGEPDMEQVDRYLWEVYQRAPMKRDHSGDFTWKDPAAAKRMGMSVPEYVVGGMEPDFREQLYHAGRAMDAAGIQWSMLSGFRDDYRQSLAKGFKARVGRSLHGGSSATGGYGHGRAVDVTNADGEAEAVWKWLDAHGAKYGLYRPIPGPDPAHVQSRGDWHKLALTLRESRLRTADAVAATERQVSPAKAKVIAKASW
jgi:hypothetical protein